MALEEWVAVVLCSGYSEDSAFYADVSKDASEQYADLLDTPKALTPIGRVSVLDHWVNHFSNSGVQRFLVITNNTHLPKFQAWAKGAGHPSACIVSDGTSSPDERLGAAGDLAFALRLDSVRNRNVVVVAGDTLLYRNFELSSLLQQSADGAILYYPITSEYTTKRGVVDVDEVTSRVTRIIEKPDPTTTSLRYASPAVYAFNPRVCEGVINYEESCRAAGSPLSEWSPLGKLLAHLIADQSITLNGVGIHGGVDISSLSHYQEVNHYFEHTLDAHLNDLALTTHSIVHRCPARIGLMGNPSDGFNGKTISILLRNFYAEVTLRTSDTMCLIRHPDHDPTEFPSLMEYHRHTTLNGYYGGLRLLQAACKKFAECCEAADVSPSRLERNFSMSYDTNIPRMVGLSGSSAIVTAAFKGLMTFYGLTLDDLRIQKPQLPQIILDIEMAELGITAGLQDRVIQVYGGVVHMDFSEKNMKELGHGVYTEHPPHILPPLYLAYNTRAAGDSGKVHSNVKQRWLEGDPVIKQGMATVAGLADKCVEALVSERWCDLPQLMRENFRNRRLMYGDAVVGARNIEMIELAAAHGMAAKFTGSGGAVVCVRDFGENLEDPPPRDAFLFTHEEEMAIKESFAAHGFEFMRVDSGENPERSTSNAMVLQID